MSVCWKCGVQGHIGDKCYQDVSALAASLVGPSVSHQPSWAHVVRGARAGPKHLQFPSPPPHPVYWPHVQKLCVPITTDVILLAKSRLAEVGEGRFGGVCEGIHPEIRDEYVREQLDKAAAQGVEASDKSAQQVQPVDESAKQVENADQHAVAVLGVAENKDVAAEVTAVSVQSNSQLDESSAGSACRCSLQ